VSGFRERPTTFGREDSLVGIHTLPTTDAVRPTVVMLNSGIVHRVGPNRLYVALARELAVAGFPSLRFDLSGVGDSAVAWDPEASDPQGMADRDVRLALDHLEGLGGGSHGYVLTGLCSGADNALRAAALDHRVVGAALIDPDIYRTTGYYLRHFSRGLVRKSTWKNILTLRHPWIRRMLGHSTPGDDIDPGPGHEMAVTHLPDRPELQRRIQALVQRRVKFLYLFSGGLEIRYNYRGQLLDALPGVDWDDCLTLEYHGDADHTFSHPHHRRRALDTMVGWFRTADFEAESRPTSARPEIP
jgi:pimeloyl-ACP methyl ester carboxylesterase